MADKETTFRLRFENDEMVRAFEQLSDQLTDIDKELKRIEKQQGRTFEEGTKAVEELTDELNDNLSALDAESVKLKEARKSADGFGSSITKAARSVTIFGVNVGDVADKLAVMKTRFAGVISGITGTNRALKAFKLALAATGIGAIVLALGSLVALLTRTQRGVDFVSRAMAGLTAAANVVIDRLSNFGQGIVQLFQGDFTGAVDTFRGSIKGIGAEISAEAGAAVELERRMQSLRDETQRFRIEEAKLRSEIELLRNAGEDTTKTLNQRQEALKKAIALENTLSEKQTRLARENLAIIKEQNALGESLFADKEAETEAAIRLAEIEGESARRIRDDADTLRGISREQAALLAEQQKAARELAESLRDVSAVYQDQEPERALQRQIDTFKELRAAVADAGIADQFSQELQDLDALITGLEDRLTDGLVKPLETLPTLIQREVDATATDYVAAGAAIAEKLSKGLTEAIAELTPAQLQFLQESFGDVFQSIAEIAISGTEIALRQQEALIDSREQAISELESQLQEQERLEEQGLANQSNRLRESLSKERAILQQEQQRRLELEKRAATQRLIVDSIQQASQVTLAVAKLLQEGASGFIPGLLAAAGGIALLFRILAQSKANAVAFAAPPQFREGTDYLIGPAHEQGGIPIEVEGGERILSRALNQRLGGSSLTNAELVEFALRGMNADSAIAPIRETVKAGQQAERKRESAQAKERTEVLAKVIATQAEATRQHMERILKERPTYYPTDQQGRREFYQGHTKVVEVIKPGN